MTRTPPSPITPPPSTAKEWPSCRTSSTWEGVSISQDQTWTVNPTPMVKRGLCPRIQCYSTGLWLQRREQEVLNTSTCSSYERTFAGPAAWGASQPPENTPRTLPVLPRARDTRQDQIVLQQNLGRLREFIFMINLMKYVNGVHAGAAHNDSKSHNSSYSHGLVLWHNLEAAPNNVLSLSVARLSTKSQDESSVRHKAACTLPA